jgi:hypothetical protein
MHNGKHLTHLVEDAFQRLPKKGPCHSSVTDIWSLASCAKSAACRFVIIGLKIYCSDTRPAGEHTSRGGPRAQRCVLFRLGLVREAHSRASQQSSADERAESEALAAMRCKAKLVECPVCSKRRAVRRKHGK